MKLDESQYDSKASDYFLLLNQKNKAVVNKRKNAKIKVHSSEEFVEYEQVYAKMKEMKSKKEIELMTAL